MRPPPTNAQAVAAVRDFAERVEARFRADAAQLAVDLRADAAEIDAALASGNLYRLRTVVGKHLPRTPERSTFAQELLTLLPPEAARGE